MKKKYNIGKLEIDFSSWFNWSWKKQLSDFIELFYNKGLGFLLGFFYGISKHDIYLICLVFWLIFHLQMKDSK